VGEAIGQPLPFAVGVALSPLPIVAVILMLITPRARANGPAFVLGWIVGIAAAGAIAFSAVALRNVTSASRGTDWISWMTLALGIALVLAAVPVWLARPRGPAGVATPTWMGALEGLTPAKAAGAGLLLSALNPKVLLLVIGAAVAAAQADLAKAQQTVAWVVFTLIATIGVTVPFVIYLAMGDRAATPLATLKTWIWRHNSAVVAVLCLVIGGKLLSDAIPAFSR
jgi:hypothetical protein